MIIDFSVAASGFIAALGGLHLTSRTLFAMGREGGLPRAFAWTHPRFRTPWTGIAFALLVTLLLGVFFAHRYDPITYFIWMATCATIGILITYILIALGGIVFFARDRGGWNLFLDLLVPAWSRSRSAVTRSTSRSSRPRPTPASSNGHPGWLSSGSGSDSSSTSLLTIRSPERVRRFGSILGSSEGASGVVPESEPVPAS